MKNILILGAAGRDFHNFNIALRDRPEFQVVGFTAAQIPGIANRPYPPELAGHLYPEGIPIFEEAELESLIGKLVVEDGPTVTHGEMPYGAGVIAARQFGAAEIVDPRPYAVGSIRYTYQSFPHLTNIVPAMGYSPTQTTELEDTINAVPCDLMLIATPIDLGRLIDIRKAHLRVTYEIEELGAPQLREIIGNFVQKHAPAALRSHVR